MSIQFNYNDGGRKKAGFKGTAGDCVTRSIAIATGKSYKEVYEDLRNENKLWAENHNDFVAKKIRKCGTTPRNGIYKEIYTSLLKKYGWEFTPTMSIGSGCKVHLRSDELPKGRLIVSVSRHYTCVIDGVLNDTYDCSRNGTRCVYGYWVNKEVK